MSGFGRTERFMAAATFGSGVGNRSRSLQATARSQRRDGRARRRAPRAAEQAHDLAVRWKLQGREVRIVLGGDQRPSEADGMTRLTRSTSTSGHGRADQVVPAHQGSVTESRELTGEAAHQALSSRASRRDGWHLAHDAADVDRVQEFRKASSAFSARTSVRPARSPSA